MRWIDIERIELPQGWLERAAEAKRNVLEDGDKLNDHSDVWRCLKDNFAVVSDYRCWICEAPVGRADNAIDHFRPKNRVAEAVRVHSGYKWLAFEKKNLRYTCTFCNSRRLDRLNGTQGGKADHFPITDEALRAYSKDDDIDNEGPLLLDPCEPDDWKFLGCSVESGSPVAATTDPEMQRRVSISIDLYHLHQEALNRMRMTQVRDLDQKIDFAKDRFDELDGSPKREKKFKDALLAIRRMITPGADFSGEMHNHVKKRREKDYQWLEKVLG